ncbi:MAG TPA: filamentous hemagglutinin N-terminal domain-containing protein, partial [Burkholderiales bacterium]|nr:filamentous hemagglutinin N-terminal domain-containing protein [Burkholderiales bacterium]
MQAAHNDLRNLRRAPRLALRPIAYCVALACCELAAAATPTGPAVVSGTASMQGLGTGHLKITNSPGAIINWQGFSIAAGNKAEFIQQSAASAVLNRVVGADISKIDGSLLSNGRVFLINPAGIVIGAGAMIDTGGFVGSTLQMQNADFLAGKLKFQADANAGSITNNGTIMARHGGNVVLIAPHIENGEKGVLQSEGGQLILAAGRKLTIASLDHEGVQFEVQAPADSVLNLGKMIADGGAIGVFAGTLKHSGDIRASGITRDEAGRIVLKAQGDVTLTAGSTTQANGKTGGAITVESASGTALVSGEVSATGSAGKGGDVRVLGVRAGVLDHAVINASGDLGGGQILVGGDYQGKNPEVRNAWQSVVGSKALLRADAITSGDGGKVIVWADGFTRFNGTITAQGGARGGNGGFAETSGHEALAIGETARVHVGAPRGRGGEWLLDPKDIIVAGPNLGVSDTAVDQFTDSPAGLVTISPITIENYTNATLNLQANNDITFDDPINHTKVDAPVLIARAGRSIKVNADIKFIGDVTLIANDITPAAGPGVDPLNRDAGPAVIEMTHGTTITSTGDLINFTSPGNVTLRMNSGSGRAPALGESGNIVVANISSANDVLIQHDGPTDGGRILMSTGPGPLSLITAARSVALDVNGPAGAGSIGVDPANPIRISTPAVEARTGAAIGGIYLESPNPGPLQIGDAALMPLGVQRGVRAVAGGNIHIKVNGNLTRFTGGTGGRISATNGTTGGNIALDGAQLGTLANPLHVDAGNLASPGSTVSVRSTGGGVFLEQLENTVRLSKYTFDTPDFSNIYLARVNGTIDVDTNISLSGRNLTLFADDLIGGITFTGPITVASTTGTLTIPVAVTAGPTVRFESGVVNLDVPATINLPVVIGGLPGNFGTANFNRDSSATAGLSLLGSGVLGGPGVLTVDGDGIWSGGTMSGSGTTRFTNSLAMDTSAKTFTNRTLITEDDVTWSAGNVAGVGGTW